VSYKVVEAEAMTDQVDQFVRPSCKALLIQRAKMLAKAHLRSPIDGPVARLLLQETEA